MTNTLDLFKLEDKVAIVTGGAAGIGIDICHALADFGAKIVVVGRGRHGSVDEIAKKIIENHDNTEAIGVKCDVGDKSSVENMFKQTIDKFGKVDILINNAGITWGTPSEKMALEDWEKVLRTNLTGAFLCSQAVAQDMIARKQGGVILNTSSIWSIRGANWGAVGYASSKAGLNGLTRQLAVEWAKYKIRVNAILLSFFPSA
ncbi:MAG: SDR family NAD(P)-dependent oxidoreductase, partial [Candidatus Hodarchaeota archaeon]